MVTLVTVAEVITAAQYLVPLVGEPRRTPASLRDHPRWEPTTKTQLLTRSNDTFTPTCSGMRNPTSSPRPSRAPAQGDVT